MYSTELATIREKIKRFTEKPSATGHYQQHLVYCTKLLGYDMRLNELQNMDAPEDKYEEKKLRQEIERIRNEVEKIVGED